MENLKALVALFNASLEHCQPQTRQLIHGAAQHHISALEQTLKKPAAPPKK